MEQEQEQRIPEDMQDLMHGLHEMAEAAPGYTNAEMYYEGSAPEFFASARLRRRLEAGSKRFRVNLAKTPVDVVVDALSVSSMVITDNPVATKALQEILATNEFEEEAPNVHRRTCEYGDGYLIVWPNEVDDTKVDLFFNDAKTVRIIYDEENPRLKKFGIKKFAMGKTVRANLMFADRIEKWVRPDSGQDKQCADWVRYYDDDIDDDAVEGAGVWPLPNPYGEVPVFHFRTERPYGVPVHKAAYGPQDSINKLVVTQMSSVDYQGYPQRYALTEAGTETDDATDFDSNWEGDDAQATRHTTDTSTMKSGPGELWYMAGVKKVGQFDVADPKVFTDPLEVMTRLMAQTSTTPLHYFDPSGDAPSGESRRVANAPFVKKVGAFQRSFGGTWNAALTFALHVLGIEVAGIDVRWDSPNSTDDKDGWDVVSAKISAGVPLRQAMLEAGYDKEQLDEWGVPELGTEVIMTLDDRAKALLDIGKAIQALGAGVGFGVVDPSQVKALVDQFITTDIPPAAVVDTVEVPLTAAEMKAKFDALGSAIRSGVEPEEAARSLGLTGISFTGATPTSLRLPVAEAAGLEAA